MRRELGDLHRHFDVLVVGGGVYGACLARITARCGLSVALIDRGDFSGGVSRNSLKIVHGGFRYIQHLDLPRIRESVLAQRAWLSAAPHLVRPLRCTIPAYGFGTRGPLIYAGGVLAYQLAAGRRNAGVRRAVRLPRAGVMSRARLLKRYPLLDRPDLTGGAYWYDAQMLDAGRLSLECLRDAGLHGAVIANHVAAVSPLVTDGRAHGVLARDELTGAQFEIRAKITLNAAGPEAETWLGLSQRQARPGPARIWTRNVNIVTTRMIDTQDAVGVGSRLPSDAALGKSNRLFFITRWRNRSIIGTSHVRHDATASGMHDGVRADVDEFLQEVRAALPAMPLDERDICSVHSGLTPAEDDVARAKRSTIVDHASADGIAGLLSVLGIKYTTAPVVAWRMLPRILSSLGKDEAKVPGDFFPALPGSPEELPARTPWETGADASEAEWARWTYGAQWERLQAQVPREGLTEDEWIFRCRVHLGLREEMVMRAADALLRATDLAERGQLTRQRIDWCADTMAAHFGWDAARISAERADLDARLRLAAVRIQPADGATPR